jgi:hypothetical protein
MLNFDIQKLATAIRTIKGTVPLDQSARTVSFLLAKLLGYAAPIPSMAPENRQHYYDEQIAPAVDLVLNQLVEVIPFDFIRTQAGVAFVWKLRLSLVYNPLTVADYKLADALFNTSHDAEFGFDYRDLFTNMDLMLKMQDVFKCFLAAECPDQPAE